MTQRGAGRGQRQKPPRRRSSPENALHLGRSISIPILYEDHHLLAIDKPSGWLTTTARWSHTKQNLQREIEIAIAKREPWVTRKGIRFLRFVHRLDRETSGVLLLAKSRHALSKVGKLFAQQKIKKLYLCAVKGSVDLVAWSCKAPLAPSNSTDNRMRIEPRNGQHATTLFKRLKTSPQRSLVLAFPQTGRTHQIRVHLQAAGHPILGDPLYSPKSEKQAPNRKGQFARQSMGLRAWAVHFQYSPNHKPIVISAPSSSFLRQFAPNVDHPDLKKALDDMEQLTQSNELVTTETGRLPNHPGNC